MAKHLEKLRSYIYIITLLINCIFTSCDKDHNDLYDNIYRENLIGTWESDDTDFTKDCLYFRGDGQGLYEYGNNSSTGNRRINFSWTYSNENRYITIEMNEYVTDLSGGQVYIGSDGRLIFDYLGARYTKISSDIPNFSTGNASGNGNSENNSGNINIALLCKNGGVWKSERNYSYVLSGNTQYCKGIDEVNFTKNGSISCSFYWECSGKNYNGVWTTRKSEATAVGSYQIQGNTLKCIFTHVTCSGSSDINTQYWTSGETNYKNYHIEYDKEYDELTMSLDKEIYSLTNKDSGSNSGGDSTSDAPDISYYDATPRTTSLKVTYRIWNKETCGTLSDAKIYYGTSSANKSVSATISGNYITANISGLSRGTKYNVKCSVKGTYGTTVTEETTLSTLY